MRPPGGETVADEGAGRWRPSWRTLDEMAVCGAREGREGGELGASSLAAGHVPGVSLRSDFRINRLESEMDSVLAVNREALKSRQL